MNSEAKLVCRKWRHPRTKVNISAMFSCVVFVESQFRKLQRTRMPTKRLKQQEVELCNWQDKSCDSFAHLSVMMARGGGVGMKSGGEEEKRGNECALINDDYFNELFLAG